MPVTILPGDNIATKIAGAANPDEFTFVGLHRVRDFTRSGFTFRSGDVIKGASGAKISGAILLSPWTQTTIGAVLSNGDPTIVWWAAGEIDPYDAGGNDYCRADYQLCRMGHDVYINDVRQRMVGTLVSLAVGTSFYDRASTKRVYIRESPTGKTIEQCAALWFTEPLGDVGSPLPGADIRISGAGPNDKFIFEKFANPVQGGPWRMSAAPRTILEDVICRYNHGSGWRPGPASTARRCKFIYNGNMGISGGEASELLNDIVVEDSEIAYNGYGGFDWGWQAGGTKFSYTNRLICRRNWFHHNYGPGLWADIDNFNALFEYNLVTDNHSFGIFYEISYDGIIRYNVIRNNGFGIEDDGASTSNRGQGAGIEISGSPRVQVYSNYLDLNADGVIGLQQDRTGFNPTYGDYDVENLKVHHNVIIVPNYTESQGNKPWHGIIDDIRGGVSEFFSSRNNEFYSNTFYMPSAGYNSFVWGGAGDRTLVSVQTGTAPTEAGSTQTTAAPPAQTYIVEPWSDTESAASLFVIGYPGMAGGFNG